MLTWLTLAEAAWPLPVPAAQALMASSSEAKFSWGSDGSMLDWEALSELTCSPLTKTCTLGERPEFDGAGVAWKTTAAPADGVLDDVVTVLVGGLLDDVVSVLAGGVLDDVVTVLVSGVLDGVVAVLADGVLDDVVAVLAGGVLTGVVAVLAVGVLDGVAAVLTGGVLDGVAAVLTGGVLAET